MDDQQKQRLEAAAKSAVACERNTGVPAELTLAQWIIESGWGEHAPGNNPFGIKAHSSAPPDGRQLLYTKEWFTAQQAAEFVNGWAGRAASLVRPTQSNSQGRSLYSVRDWFARYATLDAAFVAHAHLLMTGSYLPAWRDYWTSKNLQRYIAVIAPIYSTTQGYAAQIEAEMAQPEVAAALKAARA